MKPAEEKENKSEEDPLENLTKTESSRTGINFSKEWKRNPKELAASLHKEIESDERYQLINDAKLRALAQGTNSYDEFRHIWMAAHLKPMEKQDKLDGFLNGPNSKVLWNSIAKENDMGETSKNASNMQLNPNDLEFMTRITNPEEFSRIWRRLVNPEDKFLFLRNQLKKDNNNESTTGGSLASLWSEEIPHEIFTQVLEIFLKQLQKIDEQNASENSNDFPPEAYDILKIFEIISNSRRFGITESFMSKTEQANCRSAFTLLMKFSRNCPTDFKVEKSSETLKHWITSLQGKYYRMEFHNM